MILVDDGLATGATMRAAIRSVRQAGPARLVVAVPVAALPTHPFFAVGGHYADFLPINDVQVQRLPAEGARPRV